MTRAEVLAMKPGPEMDAAVAEIVMGWKWWRSSATGRRCMYAPGKNGNWMQTPADGTEPLVNDWSTNPSNIPYYSRSLAAVWEVVAHIVHSPGLNDQGVKLWQLDSLGFTCCEHDEDGTHGVWRCVLGRDDQSELATADTAPEAICKAALLTKVSE
jgi:hypothetical protein